MHRGVILYNVSNMLFRNLMGKIKKLNSARVLAVAFLVLIFYVGSYTFPDTVSNIGRGFVNDEDKPAVAELVDNNYRNMLGFDESNFRNKGAYINLNGLMAHLMGQRKMNGIVKLDNGHLTNDIQPYRDLALDAVQMTKLCYAQRERGKEFLFVLAPSQIPKYEDIVPIGYESHSNANGDRLIEALKANDVPVLDLREKMYEEGISHTDAFFVADHHWKPETAFWAYTKIIEYFENAGTSELIDEKYTNIENYNVEIKDDWFLGAMGKRTGKYYAGTDDFSMISPKFDTEISLGIPSREIYNKGAFRDVVFREEVLDLPNYFEISAYASYGYGRIAPLKQYRNGKASLDLQTTVIGDSFCNPPCVFLSLAVSACDVLDMAQYEDNFQEYLSEYSPDVLMVFVSVGSLPDPNTTYDFFGDFEEPLLD